MTSKELIKKLEDSTFDVNNVRCDYCRDPEIEDQFNKAVYLSRAIEIVKEIPGWISVQDRLPEESTPMEIKRVLVVFNNKITFGWYIDGRWKIEYSPSNWDIKFWQPLPEPPIGD